MDCRIEFIILLLNIHEFVVLLLEKHQEFAVPPSKNTGEFVSIIARKVPRFLMLLFWTLVSTK